MNLNSKRLSKVYKNIHEEQIEACKQFDRKAQNQIYNLYYKAMFNTSLRIVNDAVEAEDIMQESFLSAFEKINQYSGEVSFGAWFKKIVVNKSIDAIKKRKIYFEEINESVHDGFSSEEIVDDDYSNDSVEKIMQGMNKLASGYRLVLSLYLFEGYDHEEIGEIMNISSSTSRSQFTRAKRKLLKLMN